MREPDGYRDEIERLSAMFPGRSFLTMNEACSIANKHRQTLLMDNSFPAKRREGRGHYQIPIVAFARWVTTKGR